MRSAQIADHARTLSTAEVGELDPYSEVQVETGPFDMMTPQGFLHDEGFANGAAVMRRAMSRLSYARKMAWLMPRVARAVPYLGYILVSRTRSPGTREA